MSPGGNESSTALHLNRPSKCTNGCSARCLALRERQVKSRVLLRNRPSHVIIFVFLAAFYSWQVGFPREVQPHMQDWLFCLTHGRPYITGPSKTKPGHWPLGSVYFARKGVIHTNFSVNAPEFIIFPPKCRAEFLMGLHLTIIPVVSVYLPGLP